MQKKAMDSPLYIGSRRLKEKKENVIEQIKVAKEYMKTLETQKELLISALDKDRNQIELRVNTIMKILESQKLMIIEELESEKKQKLESISSFLDLANGTIEGSEQAVESAENLEKELNQDNFFKEYSAVNSLLEERFIDLLLLLDGHKGDQQHKRRDLSGVIDTVEALIQWLKSDEVSPEGHVKGSSSMVGPLEPAFLEPDMCNGRKVTGNEVRAEESNSTALDLQSSDTCYPQPRNIEFKPGMSMDIYVREVSDPQKFIAQPCGTELISMMQDMGDHYSNQDYDSITYTPATDEFCCAQFSEDECWYRARIINIFKKDSEAEVMYIDYGNQERLLYNCIKPLDLKFCHLPCQAITCSLKDVVPSSQCHGSCMWSDKICDWFSKLLLGKSFHVTVSKCLNPNQVAIEMYIPRDELTSSILSNFHHDILSQDLVPLSAFMSCIGLSCVHDSTEHDYNSTKPTDLQDNPIISSVCLSDLPSLTVKLNSSREFSCLISHVCDDMHFYVHPVQPDSGHNMTVINDILSTQYALNKTCMAMSPDSIKCGNLCVVYADDFQQWCRGVILSIRSEVSSEWKVKCLIDFIDYGGSIWIESDKLFALTRSLSELPAQVICCSLAETTLKDGEFEQRKSYEGNFASLASEQEAISECARYMEMLTDEKQLVAVVKGNAVTKDLLLVTKLDYILPVDLYDTTGDDDIHINVLWNDIVSDMKQNYDAKDPDNSSALQNWNPMEDDFLTGRNIYKVDDEDAGLALDGYENSGQICRFFATKAGCYKGKECRFLHLHQGMLDQKMEDASVKMENFLVFPRRNSWIVVIVTAVISATRFYVQLPLGCQSPLSIKQDIKKEGLEQEVYELVEDMTAYYNQQVFSERDVIPPHNGEIVAAYYLEDDHWYRARIIDSKGNTVVVFFVDYGNMSSIADMNIRSLKPEYMLLPFQAVECYLPNLLISPSYTTHFHKAREYLSDCVKNKVLIAKVITVEANGNMGLELYSTSEDGDIHINKKMVEHDVLKLEHIKTLDHIKSVSASVMQPG